MAKGLSNEFKTGLVIFVALVVFTLVAFQTGHLNVGQKGYQAKTYFGFTAGVKKFAPVRLAGVEVGEVQDVRLLYDAEETRIEVILDLDQGTRLRSDSLATVGALGLMGEKYIEINPGHSSEFVSPGGTIAAKDPLAFEELLDRAKEIADSVELTLKDFRGLVNHADDVLVDNKPKIDHMFDNFEETSEYFKEFSEDIKYHPWKVLMKGKEKSSEELERLRAARRAKREKEKAKKKAAEKEAPEKEEASLASEPDKKETTTKRTRRFDPRNRRRR